MVLDLIKKSRTHRHFFNNEIKEETILEILNGARYSGFAANKQILRYAYTVDDNKCQEIFKNIALGGALKSEEKPTIDERPKAFIVIATDDTVPENNASLQYFNMGIASQNMILIANDLGLNACVIFSFKKKEIDKIFNLPENYSSKVIIAFGKGKEEVEVVDIHKNDDSKYFRKDGKHYVPKIILEDLIIK